MSSGTLCLAAGATAVLAAACTSARTPPNYSANSVAPASTKPAPTEPAPTEPAPTEPAPSVTHSFALSSSPPSGLSTARMSPLTSGPNIRPGEKPPVLDPLGRQHSSEGALIFTSYFIHTLDWGIATTDPSLLQNSALPSCQACARYVTTLRE